LTLIFQFNVCARSSNIDLKLCLMRKRMTLLK